MDWTFELVVVPVSDQDRAKAFYMDNVGFACDVDRQVNEHFRVVQLTPPGSGCSITLMRNPEGAGSLSGLHLVVADIEQASAELRQRGTSFDGPFHFGPMGQTPGPDPDRHDYNSFLAFSDPDGNSWMVQEVRSRAKAVRKATKSSATATSTTKASPTKSATTKTTSVATKAKPATSVAAKSAASKSTATKSVAAKSVGTKSVAAKAGVSKSTASKSTATKSTATKPTATKAATAAKSTATKAVSTSRTTTAKAGAAKVGTKAAARSTSAAKTGRRGETRA